jgi:TorA maturation chaperone TorD
MVIRKKLKAQRSKASVSREAERAFQRSKIYRLLSYCFFHPDEDLGEFLRTGEFLTELENGVKGVLRAISSHEKERRIPISELKALPLLDHETMMDEYVRFLTLRSTCPPYEGEYDRSEGSVFSTEEMADIAGFYRAFGMDFVKDRADGIATELEFMHLVTMKEAEAAFKGDVEKVNLCVSVEKKFLENHLGRWVGAFYEALQSAGSSFYAPITSFLGRWIELECRSLKVTPQKVTRIRQRGPEEEDPVSLGRQYECV